MFYKYEKEIINRNSVDKFYDKDNFVGYILPSGEIYKCVEHNISNINTVLTMSLELLKNNFSNKKDILSTNTNDKLLKIVLVYLNNASHDKIVALNNFINQNNLFISDLIVQLFGCHLVTRLNKTILTANSRHDEFFNYLLNDFSIVTVDKIMYDEEKKIYKFVNSKDRNEYLYDEIDDIKKSVNSNEIDLFYKGR